MSCGKSFNRLPHTKPRLEHWLGIDVRPQKPLRVDDNHEDPPAKGWSNSSFCLYKLRSRHDSSPESQVPPVNLFWIVGQPVPPFQNEISSRIHLRVIGKAPFLETCVIPSEASTLAMSALLQGQRSVEKEDIFPAIEEKCLVYLQSTATNLNRVLPTHLREASQVLPDTAAQESKLVQLIGSHPRSRRTTSQPTPSSSVPSSAGPVQPSGPSTPEPTTDC